MKIKMPRKDYWSATRIDTANYCNMKYYLAYVDPSKPKGEQIPAFSKGRLLHKAFQEFWLLLKPEVYESNQVLSEKVSDYFKRQGWEEEAKKIKKKYDDPKSFVKHIKGKWQSTIKADQANREKLKSSNLSEKEKRKLENKLISWSFESQPHIIASSISNIMEPMFEYTFNEGPPLYSELNFNFSIQNLELNGELIHGLRFYGFIDEIRERDVKIVIRDFKSGSPYGIKEIKRDYDPQLTFYNLGLSALCYEYEEIAKLMKAEHIREQLFGGDNPMYINPEFDHEFFMVEALAVHHQYNLPPPDTNDFNSATKYQEALAEWKVRRKKIKTLPEIILPTKRSRVHFDQLISMIVGAQDIKEGKRRIYAESGRKCDLCHFKRPCTKKIHEHQDKVFTDRNGNRFLSFMTDPSKTNVTTSKSKRKSKKKKNKYQPAPNQRSFDMRLKEPWRGR